MLISKSVVYIDWFMRIAYLASTNRVIRITILGSGEKGQISNANYGFQFSKQRTCLCVPLTHRLNHF